MSFLSPSVRHISGQPFTGEIQVILGPMFSGKSTELMRRLRLYTFAKRKVLLIKYAHDKRYSDTKASTHDRRMMEATPALKLFDVGADVLDEVDVIGIDEAQFYPDLLEFCEKMANKGKIVVAAGLDGTFARKPFGKVLQLIPLAERVTKLTSVCMRCQQEAAFTARLSKERKVQMIGGNESYVATCRKCFVETWSGSRPHYSPGRQKRIRSETRVPVATMREDGQRVPSAQVTLITPITPGAEGVSLDTATATAVQIKSQLPPSFPSRASPAGVARATGASVASPPPSSANSGCSVLEEVGAVRWSQKRGRPTEEKSSGEQVQGVRQDRRPPHTPASFQSPSSDNNVSPQLARVAATKKRLVTDPRRPGQARFASSSLGDVLSPRDV